MNKIKKIALLGPECTGKTELCRQLALHFHTGWVPEFAREYLLKKNNKYSFEDVVYCMQYQIASEDTMKKLAKSFLFCDTELINFKVWFLDVFRKMPSGLEQMIKSKRYDLILLTYPDIPSEPDPLRVNQNRRQFLFDWYQRELESYYIPYVVIKGIGESRLNSAVKVVSGI